MNGSTHQFAGAIAALAITQIDSDDNCTALHHPAAAIPTGAFLGKLPDMIEPSLGNPKHRHFFHSALLGLLGVGMHKLYRWGPQDNVEGLLLGVVGPQLGLLNLLETNVPHGVVIGPASDHGDVRDSL